MKKLLMRNILKQLKNDLKELEPPDKDIDQCKLCAFIGKGVGGDYCFTRSLPPQGKCPVFYLDSHIAEARALAGLMKQYPHLSGDNNV